MALNVLFIFIVFCDECAVKGALTEQACLRELLKGSALGERKRAPIRAPIRGPIREFKGSHKGI